MKRTLLFVFSFFIAISMFAQDLFFSEYIEGSSFNKALEIYNPTNQTISLDGYAFPNVSNAPDVPGDYEYWNTFAPGAEVAPGEVYVLVHPQADQALLNKADESSFTFFSNGDDGFALVKGTEASYTVLDRIGNWDADPGTAWDVAGVSNATKDHTLIRKSSVVQGNSDWAASAGTTEQDSEWIVKDQDYFDDLGMHTYDTPTAIGDIQSFKVNVSPNPFSNELNFNSNEVKAVAIYNASGQLVKDIPVVGKSITTADLLKGMYIIQIELKDGSVSTQKVLKK